jgi:hypothetical protein
MSAGVPFDRWRKDCLLQSTNSQCRKPIHGSKHHESVFGDQCFAEINPSHMAGCAYRGEDGTSASFSQLE